MPDRFMRYECMMRQLLTRARIHIMAAAAPGQENGLQLHSATLAGMVANVLYQLNRADPRLAEAVAADLEQYVHDGRQLAAWVDTQLAERAIAVDPMQRPAYTRSG